MRIGNWENACDPRPRRANVRALPVVLCALLLLPLVAPAGAATDDEPVLLALLDTGILATHAEFDPGQVVAWRDFVNGLPAPYDDHGHGTAVASRAAGRTIGSAPGTHLIVGKVLDQNNKLQSWTPTADAIRWATDVGADVISISLWSTEAQPTSHVGLASAIDYATQRGVTVLWIAGNGGAPVISVPSTVLPGAASPQVIVVGAANDAGKRGPFSQHDPEVLAPGWNVPIAWNHGGVGIGSGTSFAAPWLSGVVVRMLEEGAPRNPDWIEWALLHVAKDDPDVLYHHEGYGFVGAAQAQQAYAIARGDAPMPGPDARDAYHVPTTAARTAQSGTVPRGVAPPL